MGRLKDLKGYLDGRRRLVADVESRLCALQSKYESFFAEVARAREVELEQLIGHATGDQALLPEWLTAELLKASSDGCHVHTSTLVDYERRRT